MKTTLLKPAGLAAVLAVIAGCASEPSVKVTRGPSQPPREPVDHGCGTVPGYDIQCVPLRPDFADTEPQVWGSSAPQVKPPPVVRFASWATAVREPDERTVFAFNATRSDLPYTTSAGSISSVATEFFSDADLYANVWQNGSFGVTKADSLPLSGIQPAGVIMDLADGTTGVQVLFEPGEGSAFTTRAAKGMLVRPNSGTEHWEYQSFGVWDLPAQGTISALSFGAATPPSAVPTTGSATFNGKLGGLYVSPSGQGSVASATVVVNADFSQRSLNFASSGTTLTRDFGSKTAAPNLNLNGTLAYAPGTNSFSGTLTNAGGTISGTSNGRFYGPAAQELGGVFTLKSPTGSETFTGAYGGKR